MSTTYVRATVPWIESPEGDVYVCPEGSGSPQLLSDAAAALWEICATPVTLSEILRELGVIDGAAVESMADQVGSRLHELVAAGVLRSAGLDEAASDAEPEPGGRSGTD